MITNEGNEKEAFSALVQEMGWSQSQAKTIQRCTAAAQEVRPHESYNAWVKTLDHPSTFGDYMHFKGLCAESARLDGWVGRHLQRFLACDTSK